MPQNDLPDDALSPEEIKSAQDDAQKLDRRTAIAQARAIRREAAALEQEAKAQAAETAAIILEQAAPEPPKTPRHKQTAPQPISNTTGKFGWLDELKPAPQVDTEAIVDELIAASAERAAQSDEDEPDEQVKKVRVEQIIADQSAAGSTDPEAAIAQVLAATAPPPSSQPEPHDLTDDAAASPDVPEDSPTAEIDKKVHRALRRLSAKEPEQSQAEASAAYRKAAEDAKRDVRKMAKEEEKEWSKEAAGVRAKRIAKRTERKTACLNVVVCFALLFGIAIGMLVLERPTVSMEENRTLAKMPDFSVEDYLDGSYTGGVAEYYNDTVPFRSVFKNLTQNIRKYMGLTGNAAIQGGVPVLQTEPAETEPVVTTMFAVTTAVTAVSSEQTASAAETTATETAPPPAEEPEQEGEISNNILIVNNRGIMLFGGYETMGEDYARNVNRYKQDLPDVNVYSMVVPTVCSFYTPDDFQYLVASEKKNIDYINSCLDGVKPVDVYSALQKHTDEPIFMRTDHHWSGLGAFYAAEAFSAAARVPFARIEEYDKHVKEGYVGTLYGYSNDITLKNNPEDFIWYTPKANYKTTFMTSSLGSPYEADFFANIDRMAAVSWYMVYMTGDDHVVHIETDVKNDRKLCVIKDSYGNALIPWLTSSFSDIYVIDMRYFRVNAVRYLKEQGVTDLLFAMNTFSANGGNAKKIETIRVQ